MGMNKQIRALSSGVAPVLAAVAVLLAATAQTRAASHDVIHRIDFTG